ncbi:hypothetical protein FOCC_FOCC014217, partial [Frankliniella occidentalis]
MGKRRKLVPPSFPCHSDRLAEQSHDERQKQPLLMYITELACTIHRTPSILLLIDRPAFQSVSVKYSGGRSRDARARPKDKFATGTTKKEVLKYIYRIENLLLLKSS